MTGEKASAANRFLFLFLFLFLLLFLFLFFFDGCELLLLWLFELEVTVLTSGRPLADAGNVKVLVSCAEGVFFSSLAAFDASFCAFRRFY